MVNVFAFSLKEIYNGVTEAGSILYNDNWKGGLHSISVTSFIISHANLFSLASSVVLVFNNNILPSL